MARLLQDYSFHDLFQFYHDRYNYDDTFAVIRSAVYFADAEDTIAPESLDGMNWDNVKKIITKKINDYYK